MAPRQTATPAAPRRYDSPVRRQHAADTRDRIIASGVDLVHSFTSWDWRELTFRAVAAGAGVSESTVYRHFANERELHDAVMDRLHEQADVSYDEISLDDVAFIAGRVVESMTSFAAESITVEPTDPTIRSIDAVRQRALLAAVADATPRWSANRQQAAAAILDVLWSPLASERLMLHWGMSSAESVTAMQWAIDLVVGAVHVGKPTPPVRPKRSGQRRTKDGH